MARSISIVININFNTKTSYTSSKDTKKNELKKVKQIIAVLCNIAMQQKKKRYDEGYEMYD